MLIAEKKKKYTIDDYMLLEEGAPFQLINYDLIMSPAPIFNHQIILGRLFNTVTNFIDQTQNEGIVAFAPVDVAFDKGNVFQPDLLFISGDRKEIITNRVDGAPDMVVEILSPSNGYYDLRFKKDIYEKYGVKEYIIVDPPEQSAELYALEKGVYQLKQKAVGDSALNSILLPGLSFDLKKIFK